MKHCSRLARKCAAVIIGVSCLLSAFAPIVGASTVPVIPVISDQPYNIAAGVESNAIRRELLGSTHVSGFASAQCVSSVWRCPAGIMLSDSAMKVILAGPCLSDKKRGESAVICGGRVSASTQLVNDAHRKSCVEV